jgi:hypothetical protein
MQVGLVTFQRLQPLLKLFNVVMELVNFPVKKMVEQLLHTVPVQTEKACQSAPSALHLPQQLPINMIAVRLHLKFLMFAAELRKLISQHAFRIKFLKDLTVFQTPPQLGFLLNQQTLNAPMALSAIQQSSANKVLVENLQLRLPVHLIKLFHHQVLIASTQQQPVLLKERIDLNVQ